MKCSLLLLTLIPFCLLAKSEVKETVDSVTYSIHSKNSNWIKHIADITIEKEQNPYSTTYSQIINGQGLTVLGFIFSYAKDGSRVSYEKDKQTKDINVSIDYGSPGSLTTEFFIGINDPKEKKRKMFKLLEAIFITKKHKVSLQKLKD